MPVPTSINDLSATASSNSPGGGEYPFVLDDHIRALGAIVRQEHDSVQSGLSARHAEIANYAAIRAYTGTSTSFYVRGVSVDRDGGAGVFRVDATDTTSADNGGTILVDTAGRRWKRDFNGDIGVKWFGAVGDGLADDYPAVQNANNAAPGKKLIFPAGTYRMASGTPVVPSNVHVVFEPGAALVQPNKGKYAGFAIAPGSTNITIEGADIRGPWYGTGPGAWSTTTVTSTTPNVDGDTWNAAMAESVGIDVRGRWYQREVLGYNAAAMGALTDTNSRIRILRNRIDGFGQGGILADQCTNLWIEDNAIFNCGRDGARMYGAFRATVRGNTVGNLAPGFGGNYPNWNVYGITATRLYGSSAVPDPNLTIGRPSENVLIDGNHVYNCHTWKSLDTHGGKKIRFIGNQIRNSYIGIGVDKGGVDATDGIAPALDILVANNTLESNGATYMRAGITIYGHDATDAQFCDGVVVAGNLLNGYGGNDTDGAVSCSNVRNISITGNVFCKSPRAALSLALDVREASISGNVIDDPQGYVTVAASAGGSGYASPPEVSFSGGGGTGLKAVATLSGGAVSSITVIHPGTGYTSAPTVTLTGGGGSGATATATFNVGYGVLSQTTKARGTINGNSFINRTQAGMRAISLQAPDAGHGVKVGNENQFSGAVTKVYPSLANERLGSYGRVPFAVGRVTSAGAITNSINIASVDKTGTGVYEITLTEAASSINNVNPIAVPYANQRLAYATMTSASTLTVNTSLVGGAAADAGFILEVGNIQP